jgi:hypothetical protein
MQGGISSLVQTLHLECLELLGDIEARLDFEDEMPILEQSEVIDRVCSVLDRIQGALATAKRGQLLQSGLQARDTGFLFYRELELNEHAFNMIIRYNYLVSVSYANHAFMTSLNSHVISLLGCKSRMNVPL